MPPRRARRDGTLFIIQPGAEGGPMERRDRAGWVARRVRGRRCGDELAADRCFADLRASLLERGFPRRGPVCLQRTGDLAAARLEILFLERRRLRGNLAAAALFGASAAAVFSLAVLWLTIGGASS